MASIFKIRLASLVGLLLIGVGPTGHALAQQGAGGKRVDSSVLRIPIEVSGLSNLQGDSPDAPVPMGSFRVMSYNIRYDNSSDGEHRWSNRAGLLAEVIRKHNPEILGIQEGLRHQVEFLDGQLPNHSYVGVGRDDGRTRGEFSAIFVDETRFGIVAQGTFWLSERPMGPSVGWDASMERICTYALLDDIHSGGYVWVLNTHFDHIGEVARQESAKLILETVQSLRQQNPSIPVVLMGDFNAIPESQPIRILQESFFDAFASRYLQSSGPIGPFGTFNGFTRQEEYRTRIDYVFHSEGLEATSYIVDDTVSKSRGLFPSDHFPVIVDLKNAW